MQAHASQLGRHPYATSISSGQSSNYRRPSLKAGNPKSSPPSSGKNVTFATGLSHTPVTTFHPGGGPLPISFLNTDSEPEGPFANTGRPMRPIGVGSSLRSVTTLSMHEGLQFSTDHDVNIAGSRYVRVGDIPPEWVQLDTLTKTLKQCSVAGHVRSFCVAAGDETNATAALYIWFDDLRDALACPQEFSDILPQATCQFVDLREYFDHDSSQWDVRLNPFGGQILFATKWSASARNFDLEKVFATMHKFAEQYGEVRSFALDEQTNTNEQTFRAEYWSISSSDKACPVADIKEFIEHENLIITITEYSPQEIPKYRYSPELNDVVKHFGNGTQRYYIPSYGSGEAREGVVRDNAPEFRQRRAEIASGAYNLARNPRKTTKITELADMEALGRSPKEDIRSQPQMVILEKIERGHDCRTTVMIRNIPNKMHAGDLKEWLDETSHGLYDFSYLRIDFSNNCNVGYAFVNFSKPEYIVDFCKRRIGTEYGYYESKKTCEVSYATIQGWECLITKFRNSSVMREAHAFRPKIFFTYESTDIPSGLRPGDEAIFPKPDNQSKLRRSLDNASSVGLYPPRSGQRGRDNHPNNRHSQFDRGTTSALLEEHAFQGFGPFGGQQMGLYNPSMTSGPLIVCITDPQQAQQVQQILNQQNGSRGQNGRRQGQRRQGAQPRHQPGQLGHVTTNAQYSFTHPRSGYSSAHSHSGQASFNNGLPAQFQGGFSQNMPNYNSTFPVQPHVGYGQFSANGGSFAQSRGGHAQANLNGGLPNQSRGGHGQGQQSSRSQPRRYDNNVNGRFY